MQRFLSEGIVSPNKIVPLIAKREESATFGKIDLVEVDFADSSCAQRFKEDVLVLE